MSTAELEAMNTVELQVETRWETVCDSADLLPNLGVRALVAGAQVALYRVQGVIYAISAIDPFTKAAVLSRGIVGDLGGRVVVASPLYKQHFDLATGVCVEDQAVQVQTFAVREVNGKVQLALR